MFHLANKLVCCQQYRLLEKLILKRVNKDTSSLAWIPDHHFVFWHAHSTIQQCHGIMNIINRPSENKQHCTAALLYISQAFDKVWYPRLLYKAKKIHPISCFNLLIQVANLKQSKWINVYLLLCHSCILQGSTLGSLRIIHNRHTNNQYKYLHVIQLYFQTMMILQLFLMWS